MRRTSALPVTIHIRVMTFAEAFAERSCAVKRRQKIPGIFLLIFCLNLESWKLASPNLLLSLVKDLLQKKW